MKRMIFLLASLAFAMPVSASPNVPLKCGANTERVWVYDNLTTLDVSARLKCGTPVDILGLEKGYVRVRTSDGNEGYVPSDAIPSSDVAALTAAAASAPTVETLASAAHANAVASAPPAPAAPTIVVQAAPAAPRPLSEPTPVMIAARVATAPSPSASVPPAGVVPAAPAPASSPAEQSTPAPIAMPTTAPAPAPAQLPTPAPSAPATRMAGVSATTAAVAAKAHANPTPAPRPAQREDATLVVEATSEPMIPTAPVATVVRTADITPATKRLAVPVAHNPEFSDDDEDTPEAVSTTDDLSACSVYFSAYGVTPMQQKWIADERKKRFPGVCPAPEPSMVDYVLIFTHDMNFFTTTLPDPIHTDKNGFSDWSPVTSADDTMIPVSSLDKAHHEYAWVFRVHRGTFDPSKFTSRRQPQFTKQESSLHASSKSIEDAMQFIAENSSAQ